MGTFSEMSCEQLVRAEGYDCSCGRHHTCAIVNNRSSRAMSETICFLRYINRAVLQVLSRAFRLIPAPLLTPVSFCDKILKVMG